MEKEDENKQTNRTQPNYNNFNFSREQFAMRSKKNSDCFISLKPCSVRMDFKEASPEAVSVVPIPDKFQIPLHLRPFIAGA